MTQFLNHDFVLPISIRSVQPHDITETRSLNRVSVTPNAQVWMVTVALAPTESAGNLLAHRARMGLNQDFLFPMPQLPNATGTGSLTVTGAIGATTLTASGNANITVGRFFTIGDDLKMYQVQKDRSGSGDLEIFPSLREAANSPQSINYSTPMLTAYYARDGREGIEWTSDGLVIHTVSVVEAVT